MSRLKLHFDADLPFQQRAIAAVCDLFRGQEICRTEFTVTRQSKNPHTQLGLGGPEIGLGNRITLLDDQILKNLQDVQNRNVLRPSTSITKSDLNFTVEMETGTGKTYVYLRTIFELNRNFGFTKFVIVVPSIAIKEGVLSTLQLTNEHFRALYAGVPINYFLYDSAKPGHVRNFATSSHIQLMIVTVGAINKKDVNNLYKEQESTGDEAPIELIKQCRPIVIIDEPQSVDGGLSGAGATAIRSMNPLCTIRYSATHVDKHHQVFRLDAVDAYEQKLVKQIEVAAATIQHAHNKPYVELVDVISKKSGISAKVRIDVQTRGKVTRKVITVHSGDDLEQASGGRAIYKDCRIGEIRAAKRLELLTPGAVDHLKPGEVVGNIEGRAIQRQMIKRTIHEHLKKELRLRAQGVKVLSLFFIDAVEKYRQYDENGNVQKGEYARIFEEEYALASKLPEYSTLFESADFSHPAAAVHDGYFSIDKKGHSADTAEGNQADRDSAERGYNLIMKDKERLLSFETPLKFIFSHSALKEGWDNPNVFQICSLRDVGTERQRRQIIGRGLRLCVNQEGKRIFGFDVNTLTVIANESYEEFAAQLQQQLVDDGYRFGIVEEHHFANLTFTDKNGQQSLLGFENSKELWAVLKKQGLIDSKGAAQDSLRKALTDRTLTLPAQFSSALPQVTDLLRKLCGRLEIKNADKGHTIRPRQAILQGTAFKDLWERIKHKTTFKVDFDNERLIIDCVRAVQGFPRIPPTVMHWQTANIEITTGGLELRDQENDSTVPLVEEDLELPDLLTELQDRTQLTRRSIHRILKESGRLNEFLGNPQKFIELVSEAITRCKRLALVNGIKYQRIGDNDYFAQELFEQDELKGYLNSSLLDAKKCVYEQVLYESEVERSFAEGLERNEAVKVYAKLPQWFKVPTPLGSYNPDWAVLVNTSAGERLYFVIETKGSVWLDDLRNDERAKIECGKAHFKALQRDGKELIYEVATSAADFLSSHV